MIHPLEQETDKAILVFMTFFIGTAFMFTPVGPQIQPFLFSSRVVYAEGYAYYLWQHLLLIVVFHVIHVEAKTFHQFFRFMFWFQVVDMIDYLLTYNANWGIVSANLVGCVVGGVILFIEYKKRKS